MNEMSKVNGVYIADVERFGYLLRVVDTNKVKAIDALKKEYEETYRDWNGVDPEYEEVSSMIHDMDVTFCEFGKVEWT